jgi:predicted N-formylglutamate amidohydrolase
MIPRHAPPSTGGRLLGPDDPAPVGVLNPDGAGDFLIIADHAGDGIPRALGDLGVSSADRARHIAVDIGVLGVSTQLSALLDAPLIHQRYSRLVIDCNRPPASPSAMPVRSDGTDVPGNRDLSAADRAMRVDEIFAPYHAAIGAGLDRRIAAGRAVAVIAMHSFTPRHGDYPAPRPWHVGVLFNRDDRLARAAIARLGADPDLVVGINEPYGVDDEIDYAVPVHCEARGLIHVEFEIRQDLIADEAGQADWARRLGRILPLALGDLAAPGSARRGATA